MEERKSAVTGADPAPGGAEAPLCGTPDGAGRSGCGEVSIRDLSNFLLDFSTTLMTAGVHTSRVVRNVTRIAASFGYEVEMTVFQKHITMSVLHGADDTSAAPPCARSSPVPSTSTPFRS